MFKVKQRVFDTFFGFGTIHDITEQIRVVFDCCDSATDLYTGYDLEGKLWSPITGGRLGRHPSLLTVEQAAHLGHKDTPPPSPFAELEIAKTRYYERAGRAPRTVVLGHKFVLRLEKEVQLRGTPLPPGEYGPRIPTSMLGMEVIPLCRGYGTADTGFAFLEQP